MAKRVKKRKTGKKRRTVRQTGSRQTRKGLRADKRLRAKAPGKRKSKSGRIYFESRRNRSDKSRRKRI